MVAINTNVSAAIARNAIQRNESDMTQAMERLSTGLRINSAADDAAGLAIASKFSNQVAGLQQAARNANDGISMVQTAEGAYVEVGEMLQRMRELAVQAASETYSTTDRAALDLEFQALQDELVTIAGNTQWNGFNILDGTAGTSGTVKIQSGSNASQTVDVNFGNLYKQVVGSATNADVTAASGGNAGVDSADLGSGTTITAGDVLTFTVKSTSSGEELDVALTLTQDAVDGITTNHADTDLTAGATLVVDGGKTLATGHSALGALTIQTAAGAANGLFYVHATTADTPFTIENVKLVQGSTAALEIADVKTQATANQAISMLDTAMESVNTQRASYGSYISRLEHASTNLSNVALNMNASRSRIEDADYATETTELARTQIIAQASTAMLAQANAIKSTVLELLA